MSDNRGIIGTGKEEKKIEDSSEEHASSSSQTAVASHRKGPEPGKEIQLGSAIRRPVYSGSPTKVGEKIGIFLFGVFVTPGDVELDRLLIPVEEALDYFPPLAHRQETYNENIEISDPRNVDWRMTLGYDTSECSFVMSSQWKMFVASNHLGIMDVIRFYKPVPLSYNNHYLIEIVKRRHPDDIPEFKPENLLFELPLTEMDVMLERLFIRAEDLRTYFPAIGLPAETHTMERLYFTDYLNGQWCIRIICYDVIFQLAMEEFMTAHVLEVGDMIRFFKPDQPLHSRHFLLGFRKGPAATTQAGTAEINDSTDRGGDRQSDDEGGTDGGGNRQGDGEGGSRSGSRKRWKFGFGGCCMAGKNSARTQKSCDQESGD